MSTPPKWRNFPDVDTSSGSPPASSRSRDAVSVVSEIAQHVFRSTEGRLGIDDPVLSKQHSEPGCEGLRISKRSELAVELNRGIAECSLERGDELAAEDTAEHLDGQEVVRTARDPS